LPLDLMLVASANPEDYTHRGRIITPLKDRFGSQVRTHYPEDIEDEIAIMDQEAAPPPEGVPVAVPRHLKEVVAAFAAQLRTSAQVNQRSGVSVRFSIGALETVGASALRRAVRAGEPEAVPRMVDLWSVLPASIGRIEFDSLEEGREPEILARALKQAVATVWRARLGGEDFTPLLERFEAGLTVDTSDSMSSADFLAQFGVGGHTTTVPGLERLVRRLGVTEESPAGVAGAIEFTLEGLHLGKRLNKESAGAGFVFGDI
ncbi:MAG: magnesium chelatase, partial [Actinobacteria bacterium]|nr:magnesium chelatase [Actinomycetota bacterium]